MGGFSRPKSPPLPGDADQIAVDATGFLVSAGADVQSWAASVDARLLDARATGLVTGGAVTITGDLEVTVAAGTGAILSTAGSYSDIAWSETVLAVTGASGQALRWVRVTAAGTPEVTLEPDNEERARDHVYLKTLSVTDNVITGRANVAVQPQQAAQQLRDVMRVLGVLRAEGITLGPAGGLQLEFTAGAVLAPGGGTEAGQSAAPHRISIAASSPAAFRMAYRGGLVPSDVLDLPVGVYDLNGVLTAVPGASSRATVTTMHLFPRTCAGSMARRSTTASTMAWPLFGHASRSPYRTSHGATRSWSGGS